MEGVICKVSTTVVTNEPLCKRPAEDVMNVEIENNLIAMSPENNKENNVKDNKNENDIGQVEKTSESSGGVDESDNNHKNVSSTIIGHAISVMKNLFSPDKSKNKPQNTLNPIHEQQTATESPSNSVNVSKKPELFATEGETEISKTDQPGLRENSFKEQIFIGNQIEIVQSSPSPHNNTDDSFLTTVSLIDESFQSAITHFDENGAILTENCLNNSRSLDAFDPYNDTLENSDYLENTMLKNGSFASESSQPSNEMKDGNRLSLKNVETMVVMDKTVVEDTGKDLKTECRQDALVENSCGISNESEKGENNSPESSVITSQVINGDLKEKNCHEFSGSSKLVNNQQIINDEVDGPMKNLFLSTSFEKPTDVPLECGLNIVCGMENHETKENTGDGNVEISNEDRESVVEDSISTTTVVLNPVSSEELDSLLCTLKSEDFLSNTTSLTSLEESEELTTGLDPTEKQLVKKPEFNKIDSSGRGIKEVSSFNQEKRFSKSEGNSPDKLCSSNIQKLNKSVDFISGRSSSKSSKGRRTVHEKESTQSCVDISLIKTSEALESSLNVNTCGKDGSKISSSEVMTILNPVLIDVKCKNLKNSMRNDDFEKNNDVDIEQSENESPHVALDGAFITAQESYTILSDNNNSLNRPVIGSTSCVVENSSRDVESYISFGGDSKSIEVNDNDSLAKDLKQSTPVCGGSVMHLQSPSAETFVKENPTNFALPVLADNGKVSKPDFLGKAMQIFSSSIDEFEEFLPMTPTHNSGVFGISIQSFPQGNDSCNVSVNSLMDGTRSLHGKLDPNKNLGRKINQTFEISSRSQSPVSDRPISTHEKTPDVEGYNKMNETFDKNRNSPVKNELNHSDCTTKPAGSNKLNETFDKSSNKLNQTFNINTENSGNKRDSTNSEKLNETYDKPRESPEPRKLNETYDKVECTGTSKLNETYDKKSGTPKEIKLNQTFDKKLELSSDSELDKNSPGDEKRKNSSQSNKLNETYDKPTESPGANQLNKTYDKKSPSPVSQVMNQTFSKNRMSRSFVNDAQGKMIHDTKENPTARSSEGLGQQMSKGVPEEKLSPQLLLNGEGIEHIELGSLRDVLNGSFLSTASSNGSKDQTIFVDEKLSTSPRQEKLQCEADLAQLIKEQFSSKDIEKICSVVDDLSSMRLSCDILKASEQFDKSFHESLAHDEFKVPQVEFKPEKIMTAISPQSFDFLNSIGGKPTGRDLSRESLYVKFDPLVQPAHANSLIDFTKEVEALTSQEPSPEANSGNNICENLLAISPQKKPDDIVPPLTPLSHKNKNLSEDETERLKKLQNEIYFLKNLYAERERANKAKMDDFESQITKLTGQNCILEDKLKESNEREKSLVKKMKEQTQSIGQLKVIMEEYIKVISKLTAELESLKQESSKQLEALIAEKDSYLADLQNTEAAFTSVHAKYEKSKKTIQNLKTNESVLMNTIAQNSQKIEEFKEKTKQAQEKASREYGKLREELEELKGGHAQEAARLRAQLKKTELKLEAVQESLDQKIKENQQLTAICDELIEGKK